MSNLWGLVGSNIVQGGPRQVSRNTCYPFLLVGHFWDVSAKCQAGVAIKLLECISFLQREYRDVLSRWLGQHQLTLWPCDYLLASADILGSGEIEHIYRNGAVTVDDIYNITYSGKNRMPVSLCLHNLPHLISVMGFRSVSWAEF